MLQKTNMTHLSDTVTFATKGEWDMAYIPLVHYLWTKVEVYGIIYTYLSWPLIGQECMSYEIIVSPLWTFLDLS